jgi:hypothetical protein
MELYYGSEKTLYEYNVTTFCVFPIPTDQNIGRKILMFISLFSN